MSASSALSSLRIARQKNSCLTFRVLPKSHARPAAPPLREPPAHLRPRGARTRDAVPQVGGRQDFAPAGADETRAGAAAEVPRAVRRRRRALLRGPAAAGVSQRFERRAGALLPAGARRRLLGPRRPRAARLRTRALRGGAPAGAAASHVRRARGAVHP